VSAAGTRHDRVSQAAAAALLLAGLLALALLVVAPFGRAWHDAHQSVADARTLLAGFERAAAEIPALEARLRALGGQAGAAQPGLLDAGNAPLASAQLQSAVKAIVAAAGGQVRSVQDLPATRVGGFQQVGIRIDIAIPTPGLQQALYRIEAAQPYMFVDALAIRAAETLRTPRASGGGDALSVRAEILAYIRATAP